MSSTSIKNRYKLSVFNNNLLFVVFISLGFLSSYAYNDTSKLDHYSQFIGDKNYIKAKALESPIEKDKSFKIETTILASNHLGKQYSTSGKIILYFEKDSLIAEIKNGDILFIKIKINEIENPKNPNEFNFKKYLSYKNIHHQAYINSQSWIRVSESKNIITNTLHKVKKHLQTIIHKYITGKDEQAVASALLLGNRTYLTDNILQAFSSSGATHILAVSGLHVGVFYGILTLTLNWLDKFKKYKILKPILVLIGIWFYVGLTGASPSVVRAATMFSLFALGSLVRKNISVYNIIAFSAFIITAYNPYIITEVGFQLSYLAVIGIIYLQRKIYTLIYFRNFILDKIWTITSVSIAAQISTFPLIVLYFHQFPNLFWVSNLIVIPAASLILYLGIIFFLFSWNELLLIYLGKLLNFIIYYLNQSLILIEQVPYALSSKLYISHLQALLFYIIIILTVFAVEKRNKLLLKYSLIILLILSITITHKYFEIHTQKKIIVYHVPHKSAIEFIAKEKSYSLFETSLLDNEKLLTFRVKHNWWEKQIQTQYYNLDRLKQHIYLNNKIISFQNKTILLLDKEFKLPNKPIKVDFTIISHSPKLYLSSLASKIKADTYIFDTSNNAWQEKYWKLDCEKLGLNCYFVSDTTAFEIDL